MLTLTSKSLSIAVILCLSTAIVVGGDADTESRDIGEHLDRSVDFYDAGRFQESLASAEAAVELSKRQGAIAYNNVCTAQMRLGALEQAAQACNAALRLMPDYDRAWANLAWVYGKQVEVEPTSGNFLNLSVAYYWQGRIADSIAAAESALVHDPASAVAHNNICAANARNGDWSAAVTACEAALRLDPDYALARNNLDWATNRASEGAP